ncbi:nucleolar complex protein 14 [Actinomortierella ambigua]|nr:nucleolar complex protein 14 [Actinomortierella ambigua]
MAKSALYRLKASLKEAGAIGPNSRASLSKKERKKGRPTAASAKNDLNRKLESIRDAMNPFEVKVTKQKYDVLGRKTKGVEGKPTLSKQVGEENRRKTLLQELQKKNKAGGMVDRRFGEDNPNLTPEEKMLERFTKEKQSRAKGGAMFNLEEESDLTHYGQSLAGLDDFDESGLGYGDEDEDDKGAISSDIVSQIHFGGFGDEEGAVDEKDENGRPKSKADIMKEVIAKSKYYKHERQKEREETEDMRKELDDELDDIRGLLGFSNEAAEESRPKKRAPLPSQRAEATRALDRLADEEKERMKTDRESGVLDKGFDDDYDKFVRELAYDRRAKPQDRMKSEEEVAQEEAEKLEKAERARKRRMEGLTAEEEEEEGGYRKRRKAAAAAPSADDLEDNFALEDDVTFGLGAGMAKVSDEFQGVGIKAGRLPSKRDAKKASKQVDRDEEEEEEEEEEEDDDEEGEEEGSEEEEDDDDDMEGDESDDYSDLDIEEDGFVAGESDNDGDDMNDMTSAKKVKAKSTTAGETPKKLAKTKSSDAAAAAAELPFTFPCPTSLSEFLNMTKDIALKDIPTVVHRIRALHHPKLSPQNKQKMEVFFPILLDYILQISGHKEYPTAALNALTRHLYAMTAQLGDHATSCILSFLEAFEAELQTQTTSGHGSGMPGSDKLTLLRVLGQIYSTSDFQHQVITPAQLLMSQYLGQCQVQTGRDLASGLMLCNLFLDYQNLSKRVVPEAVNFLGSSMVYLAPKGIFQEVETVPGNFPLLEVQKPALQLPAQGLEALEPRPLNFGQVFNGSPKSLDTDQFRCSALSATVDILVKYAILYGSTSAFKELFEGSIKILKALNQPRKAPFHTKLRQQLTQAQDRLEKLQMFATEGRTPLQLQAHKPVPIASYVPKFEEGYSMDKHYDPDTERAQLAKLQSQVRKEKKGAIRELRKDAAFIAREKLRVQREKDAVYNAKIKGIMSGLEVEQGEKNSEERMKKMQKMKSKRG